MNGLNTTLSAQSPTASTIRVSIFRVSVSSSATGISVIPAPRSPAATPRRW